jgi:hypothetical protein
MYHLELRQFPHNLCRFNLTHQELWAVLHPWARGQWVELGERKWNSNQARLTVLEGPQLAVEQLAMGRGWRAAKRASEDVTERVLQAAKAAIAQAANTAPSTAPAAGAQLSDPLALAVQIGSLLGPDPIRLLEAWRAAAAGAPGLPPSESLALAEKALASPDGGTG